MTPADYLGTVVLPTLAEFMEAPGDQRRAYLACIAAAHLVDHVDVAHGSPKDGKRDVRRAVRALGPYPAACLAIVEGVSNGTKHAQPDPRPPPHFKFAPGLERIIPAFGLDAPGSGLDESVWDKPGVAVDHAEGLWFVDDCVRATIRSYDEAFRGLFTGVDLAMVAEDRDRLGPLSLAMSTLDDGTPWPRPSSPGRS